jgi:hypothetical protein
MVLLRDMGNSGSGGHPGITGSAADERRAGNTEHWWPTIPPLSVAQSGINGIINRTVSQVVPGRRPVVWYKWQNL